MNFNWNEDTIKWYQEANEYTGFFRNIAELIIPKLDGYTTLCDIGCGLGLLDLELSHKLKKITCIDINKEALKSLNKSIKQKKIKNIEPKLMNCENIEEDFDIICLSFFGTHDLHKFLTKCKKLIAIVEKKGEKDSKLEKYRLYKKNSLENVKRNLLNNKINYSVKEFSLEFGQPLRSIEEAKNFIKSSTPNINEEDLHNFLVDRTTLTNKIKYPIYIPKLKNIGIFEIEGHLN